MPNIRRAPGRNGRLEPIINDFMGLSPHLYLDENSKETPFPANLEILFDVDETTAVRMESVQMELPPVSAPMQAGPLASFFGSQAQPPAQNGSGGETPSRRTSLLGKMTGTFQSRRKASKGPSIVEDKKDEGAN